MNWIKVKEQLPEKGVWVLIAGKELAAPFVARLKNPIGMPKDYIWEFVGFSAIPYNSAQYWAIISDIPKDINEDI